MAAIQYKRVLLKLSGESLCQPGGYGLDGAVITAIAERLATLCKTGLQVAIVVGGGNFLRGSTFSEKSRIPRATADYMGMMATIMNACALQETLESVGQPARVLSALPIPAVCEPFIHRRGIRHLEKGRVVILAGGTGSPFFSTDSGAALRSSELGVELMIKATKVDGVYTDDPVKNPDATLIERLTYHEILEKNLKVMDPAAVSLCRENHIPIIVLNIFKEGNITRALQGEKVGTLICEK